MSDSISHFLWSLSYIKENLKTKNLEACVNKWIFIINLKTTPAESPWSNGLIERHNLIVGDMVTNVMKDKEFNLETALAWAISSKNSLGSNDWQSLNQLVFGRNPNYPVVSW